MNWIYIAGFFETVDRSACGQKGSSIDNDPHFWTSPPTWGICRPDLRRNVERGDFVFFVLPKHGRHPQMVFGYLKVAEIISHLDAFSRAELRSKRMGNKVPNGNIIVDASGRYNRFDAGAHRRGFERIKREYVIGSASESRMLTATEIGRLAPNFVVTLGSILDRPGDRAIDIISRKGRKLTTRQVDRLLTWLNR